MQSHPTGHDNDIKLSTIHMNFLAMDNISLVHMVSEQYGNEWIISVLKTAKCPMKKEISGHARNHTKCNMRIECPLTKKSIKGSSTNNKTT
jgi:hypothetical protein